MATLTIKKITCVEEQIFIDRLKKMGELNMFDYRMSDEILKEVEEVCKNSEVEVKETLETLNEVEKTEVEKTDEMKKEVLKTDDLLKTAERIEEEKFLKQLFNLK